MKRWRDFVLFCFWLKFSYPKPELFCCRKLSPIKTKTCIRFLTSQNIPKLSSLVLRPNVIVCTQSMDADVIKSSVKSISRQGIETFVVNIANLHQWMNRKSIFMCKTDDGKIESCCLSSFYNSNKPLVDSRGILQRCMFIGRRSGWRRILYGHLKNIVSLIYIDTCADEHNRA